MREDTGAGYHAAWAIGGGIIATLAMTLYAYVIAPATGLPVLDFGMLIGTLFLPAGTMAVALGIVIAVLAGIIWALLYARLVRAVVPGWDWLTATVWGLVAWVIAGLMLGVVGAFHPLIATGVLTNPGFFGLAFGGWQVPVGICLAFLIYGVVLGLVFELANARGPERAGSHAAISS